MLDIRLDWNDEAIDAASEEVILFCDTCGQEALIFQVVGNFCLKCWQDRTEPNT